MIKINKKIGPTKVLLISLIAVIIVGACILKLPICNNKPIKTIDSIFVATSATCVTGLTTIVPIEQFTIIGQIVLLALIQIGGIGLMTLISIVLITIGKKLNLSDKLIIKESLNQESFKGLATLIKKICIYTVILEFIGACILATKFIPDFGIGKGIWFSIFHSISAFCNAGFDLLGSTSVSLYSGDWTVCLTLMALIVIGGLGFTVWDDIVENIKNKKNFNQLTVHTKIVLLITAILLIIGTILILIFECDNMQTMKTDHLRNQNFKIGISINNTKDGGILQYTTKRTNISIKIIICLFDVYRRFTSKYSRRHKNSYIRGDNIISD